MSKIDNIVVLDEYRVQKLETIFKRDLNSTRFVTAIYIEDDKLATYISDDISDMELCYLISELERRRRELFDYE